MSLLNEAISRQFRTWEMRGRGGHLYNRPVSIEPPFEPFRGYELNMHPVDEGRRSTLLGRLWSGLTAPAPTPGAATGDIAQDAPYYREPEEYQELQLTLPETNGFSPSAFA